MRTVRGYTKDVSEWVARRIPEVRPLGFSTCQAIGVLSKDGMPVGGVVFHDWQPAFKTIAVSVASDTPRWLTHRIVADILSYPFEQIGVFKVWATVSLDNERSLRLVQGLGFSKEATLRHQFGYRKHAAFFGMTAPEFSAKYRKDRNETRLPNPA